MAIAELKKTAPVRPCLQSKVIALTPNVMLPSLAVKMALEKAA